MDFAQARMYGGNHGRFTSPDPLLSSGDIASPESWNRYAYSFNNPLKFTDPAGLYVCTANKTQCQQFQDGLSNARANLANIETTHGKKSDEYKDAKRAVDVYGCGVGDGSGCTAKQANNGVTIAATTGTSYTGVSGIAGTPTAANPTGQNITVNFSEKDFGNADDTGFQGLIAHEGSHAADGHDWVASKFSESKHPTLYATESKAYKVTSLFAQANGDRVSALPISSVTDQIPYPIGRIEIWSSGWAAVDRTRLRSEQINLFLKYEKLYQVTPEKQGAKQWVKGRR